MGQWAGRSAGRPIGSPVGGGAVLHCLGLPRHSSPQYDSSRLPETGVGGANPVKLANNMNNMSFFYSLFSVEV